MKTLTPGHLYLLDYFENPEVFGQKLQFIHKSTGFKTVANGTTTEEVLAVLIDRLQFLDDKFPCEESKSAIGHLQIALNTLNFRTEQRKLRGVEGKALA